MVHGLAEREVQNQLMIPLITPGKTAESVFVGQTHLSYSSLRRGYQKGLDEGIRLSKELLMGLDIPIDPTMVHDQRNDFRIDGMLMASRDPEQAQRVRHSLMNHVLLNPTLKAKFFDDVAEESAHGGESTLIMKEEAVKKCLRLHKRLMRVLLFLIHVGGGSPARATELTMLHLANSLSAKRSVNISGDRLVLLAQYNKTRVVKRATSEIARFVCRSLTKLMLLDILVFRPFMDSIYPEGQGTFSRDLFTSMGTKWTEEQIRDTFPRMFEEFVGTHITISMYRHFAAYVFHEHMRTSGRLIFEDLDDDDDSDYVSMQFGHSATTAARHYGTSFADFGALRGYKALNQAKVSTSWHIFLGQDIPEAIPRPSPSPSQVLSAQGSQECGTVGEKQVLREIIDLADLSFKPTGLLRMTTFDAGVFDASSYPTPISCFDVHTLLKDFFKTPTANFKNATQLSAIELCLGTGKNLVVVQPTSAGKSLIFQLYAFAQYTNVSLVIVPTVSLQQHLIERCRNAGIRTIGKVRLFDQGVKLIIATPENVQDPESIKILRGLSVNDLLGRIFIDEAHEFVKSASYRLAMVEVPRLIFNLAPIVLLTATAPDWIHSTLKDLFFSPSTPPIILRDETVRGNIAYYVKQKSADQRIEEIRLMSRSLNSADRIIIYTALIQEIKVISELLIDSDISNFAVVHGEMPAIEVEQNVTNWFQGDSKIMIATASFGMGIDFPSVRCVYFWGAPFDIEDFAQQSGRAGRDGLRAESIVFLDCNISSKIFSKAEDTIYKRHLLLLQFFENNSTCIRRMLSRYFDGKDVSCFSKLDEYKLCMICLDSRFSLRDKIGSLNEVKRTKKKRERELQSLDEASENDDLNRKSYGHVQNTNNILTSSSMLEEFKMADFESIRNNSAETSRNLPVNNVPAGGLNVNVFWSSQKLYKLRSYMKIFQSKCIVCLFEKNQVSSHLIRPGKTIINSCPRMFGRCYRDLGFHTKTKDCPAKPKMNGSCAFCLMPQEIEGINIHDGEFGRNPGCNNQDTLNIFGLLISQKHQTELLASTVFRHRGRYMFVLEVFYIYMNELEAKKHNIFN